MKLPSHISHCRKSVHDNPIQCSLIAITHGRCDRRRPRSHHEESGSRRSLRAVPAARDRRCRAVRQAGAIVGVALDVRSIETPEAGEFRSGIVDCLDLKLIPPGLPFGKLSPVAGDAAYQYLRVATEPRRCGQGRRDLHGAAQQGGAACRAGHKFPGHTEMLAALTGTQEVSMMLTAPNLRVIHVTTHIGLADAIRKIEPGLVERTIARGYSVLEKAGARATQDRGLRDQSPRRRERLVRPGRGGGEDRAGDPGLPRQGLGCRGAAPGGYIVSSEPVVAISTWWSRCTTTRAMDRSRCWDWKPE